MLDVRSNPKNRLLRSINGRTYLGPLNLSARRLLYERLKELEKAIEINILSPEDETKIFDLWDKETL